MSIKQYISDLLFLYDVVIIPDFGGFASSYRDAEISNNSFLPPFKDIMFNADLKANDGILLTSIVKNEGIEQYQAIEKIREFVKQMNNDLQAKETIVFDGVGSIKLGKEDKIFFEPDNSVNYLIEAYGLSSFNSPLVNSDELSLNNKETIKLLLLHRYTKRLAVGLPLALALTLIPLKSNFIKNFSSLNIFPSYTNEQPLDNFDTTGNSNSVENAIDELTNNRNALYTDNVSNDEVNKKHKVELNKELKPNKAIVKEESVVEPEHKVKKAEKIVIKTIESANKRYCLIVGSFSTKSNAKKQINNLKNIVSDATILEKNGKYRVVAQSFEKRTDAKLKAKKLKKLHKISSWILDSK